MERLAEIIYKNNFSYEETIRLFFYFLYQLPFVLYLKIFSNSPLYLIKFIYSLSLLWIHILSFIGCYFILPKHKKDFIFFPLMGFVFGPMPSLGLSISVSFLVCSFIWMTAFIIYYSNLSIKSHKILFIISISGLFFSHEMMSYMAWPLIFLCFYKLKLTKTNKPVIYLAIALLFINSLISTFFVLFPDFTAHRSYFIESLKNFYFFYKNGFYAPTMSSFLLLVIFFVNYIFPQHFSKKSIWLIYPFFCFFCVMNIINPYNPVFGDTIAFWNEYDKRVWPVIVLPFTLLVWWLFENKKTTFSKNPLFILSCVLLTISLTGWRTGSDYRFYQYQNQLARKLLNCSGFVSWEMVQKNTKPFKPLFLEKFYELQEDPDEHIINVSLFYSHSFKVKSIIQSEFKPLWFCRAFFPQKAIFKNKTNYMNFINLNCKEKIIDNIQINKFDFSEFFLALASKKTFCQIN